jgi:hypothetical protein
MLKVPVLIVLYNEVEDTHNLFQIIRKIQPEKIYVAGDGAIHNDRLDYVLCVRTRAVILPEWKCEVKELFIEEHLGKAKMITTAMDWFFHQEEEGIVLFATTHPHLDFFPYCEELLEKYRNDKQVNHISGSNLSRKNVKTNTSYYFSAYPFIWGFATWADRWQGYNLKLCEWDHDNFNTAMNRYVFSNEEKMHWLKRYNILRKHDLDIWEYQYIYHTWHQNGLSITPIHNLVTNVGLRDKPRRIRKLMRKTKNILPLKHPTDIIQDKDADKYVFKRIYKKAFLRMFADLFNEYLLGKEKKI